VSSLGLPSYDALSAQINGLSDQCIGIELTLDNTVRMYEFGDHSVTTGKGIRSCWWRCWIVDGDTNPTEYFALKWSSDPADSTIDVTALTPDDTKKAMVLVKANVLYPGFVIQAPVDKPYGYFRWSKSDSGTLLRACRILPPYTPEGTL
jgi:hypothetical protein